MQLEERDADITDLRVLGVEPGALRLDSAAGLWSVGFGEWDGDRSAIADVWLLIQYGSSSDE